MLSALDKHGRLCYKSNGQNFVHTSKWGTVSRQPPNKQFCCKGVFLLASREARELSELTENATPHSQLFLFSSQMSQSPAASHSLLSFSLSSRHLRFLQLPARQEGHSCFSSSSGQRDKVLERAEMKGELSVSFCSSASCSSEASSALK